MSGNRNRDKCEPSSDWVRPEGVTSGMWESITCPEMRLARIRIPLLMFAYIGMLYCLANMPPWIAYWIKPIGGYLVILGGIGMVLTSVLYYVRARIVQNRYNHAPWDYGGHPVKF